LPDLKFEPINAEIRSVTLQDDAEGGLTAIVAWTGKPTDTAKVLEFDYGEQGTWARLLLSDGRQLCITQSGTMQPSCYYIIGEEIPVPEEPAGVIE
jgi:hypothetical protein